MVRQNMEKDGARHNAPAFMTRSRFVAALLFALVCCSSLLLHSFNIVLPIKLATEQQ